MAVKDIASNLQTSVLNLVFTSDTTLNSDSVDTADFELGFMLNIDVPPSLFNDGSYTVKFQESEDDTTFTDVEPSQVIGALDENPIISASTNGSVLPKLGLFGNKRYVRVVVTSTSVTDGASLVLLVTQKGETLPL